MSDVEQEGMFDAEEFEPWREEWRGMPEYRNKNLEPWKSVLVHFATRTDMAIFFDLIKQPHGMGPGGSIWFPPAEVDRMSDKRYVDAGATDFSAFEAGEFDAIPLADEDV